MRCGNPMAYVLADRQTFGETRGRRSLYKKRPADCSHDGAPGNQAVLDGPQRPKHLKNGTEPTSTEY